MAEPVTKLPVKTEEKETERVPGEWRPLANLRREIDRLFDDLHWGGWRRPIARTLFDVEPFWRGSTGWGGVSAEREVDAMLWERFVANQQAAETRQTWPSTGDQTK